MPFDHVIRTPDELYATYSEPGDGVRAKAVATFDEHCRAYIALSPFVLVATVDSEGRCDVSPRGGDAGFVTVLDDTRLAIPDASGNNRLDTLRNVTQTGQIGLLFLIPGLAETLRVNGRACITTDPELLAAHVVGQGKPPKAVIGSISSRRSCTAPRRSCARTSGSPAPGPIAAASHGRHRSGGRHRDARAARRRRGVARERLRDEHVARASGGASGRCEPPHTEP